MAPDLPAGENISLPVLTLPHPDVGSIGQWLGGRRLAVVALTLLSLAPVFFVFARTADARSDVVYWDEFDTALAFVVHLKEDASPGAVLHELFSVNNEHRMVTSRLLFAGYYWLTGGLNFSMIDFVGNGTLVAACLLLVLTAGSGMRRLRIGVILAFLVFQLESYENFLWSGSSIDHFQVLLYAVAAIVALAGGTSRALFVGGLFGLLATFTLAHGIAIWTVGATTLWLARRIRHMLIWCGFGMIAVVGFFSGFKVNGAESFAGISFEGAQKIFRYWLSILGAVPALDNATLAPWCGGALLLLLAFSISRGALRRERIAVPLAHFAVVAAGLIAIGRAEQSGGHIHSRYYVLSALAWALGIFLLMERHANPRRPWRLLMTSLPVLVVFNFFANREFSDETDSWLSCRDIATVTYKQFGVDGRGNFNLYPNPERSTSLLKKAEALGIYRLGPICREVSFPEDASESGRIASEIDEITLNATAVSVRGWAAIPGRTSERGSIHLVLRSSGETHLFTTVTVPRADVPAVTRQPGWGNSGFHFARQRARMPAGDFQIGLLIADGRGTEFVMTNRHLKIDFDGAATLIAGK